MRKLLTVTTTQIDDQDVIVVEGSGGYPEPLKLYFDKNSGLLVRQVRYVQLPLGRVPSQSDYSDYREVAGVKLPFKVVTAWVSGRSTVKLTDVQPNAPIDASRFTKPN